MARVPAKSSAACVLAAASRLAVQGARDLTAPVVVVVPVVLRSMIVLGLALRDFMAASACFAGCGGIRSEPFGGRRVRRGPVRFGGVVRGRKTAQPLRASTAALFG